MSSFQCRDRTSPIILDLRSKRFPAHLPSSKIPPPSNSRVRAISYCVTGGRWACSTASLHIEHTVSAPYPRPFFRDLKRVLAVNRSDGLDHESMHDAAGIAN